MLSHKNMLKALSNTTRSQNLENSSFDFSNVSCFYFFFGESSILHLFFLKKKKLDQSIIVVIIISKLIYFIRKY